MVRITYCTEQNNYIYQFDCTVLITRSPLVLFKWALSRNDDSVIGMMKAEGGYYGPHWDTKDHRWGFTLFQPSVLPQEDDPYLRSRLMYPTLFTWIINLTLFTWWIFLNPSFLRGTWYRICSLKLCLWSDKIYKNIWSFFKTVII